MPTRRDTLFWGTIYKDKQNPECCPLIAIEDSDTVTHTGLGTPQSPFIFTAITGGGTLTGAINGLSVSGTNAELGGTLTQATSILQNGHNVTFNSLSSTASPQSVALQTGQDDVLLISTLNTGYARYTITNLDASTNAAAGFLAINNAGGLVTVRQCSSGSSYVPNGTIVGSQGSTGGLWILSDSGPIVFGNSLTSGQVISHEFARFVNTNGHLLLGSTTDNGYRLQVTGGLTLSPITLPVTPVNNALETDGTNLYFTVGGVRKTVTLT